MALIIIFDTYRVLGLTNIRIIIVRLNARARVGVRVRVGTFSERKRAVHNPIQGG